ncbi:MAG: molybdenum cofactor biosynthesis protein MoaE, partial [Alicyclobacillus sp.]|nr:molybdenum cofactor biosynthesis protein MoaE [Alicyclobacillus sp.]
AWERELEQALVAVNLQYAEDTVCLREDDEIALIPPVGGGAKADHDCRIQVEPLDLSAAYDFLVRPECGGTVLFSGTVREWTGERRTAHLEYEAYEAMALTQMRAIAADVARQFPGVVTLQWHRTGHLLPTEIAVICGASAPHRDAAFQAARLLIDRLKREVPIWKKEIYADGAVTWQPNP